LILDTNALSAFSEGHPGIAAIVAEAQQIALPVIVLGEYRYGIAQSRHAARYRRWLDGLLSDCAVLDVTEPTTNHYAAITIELRRAGKPIPTNDLWIAALCRQYRLPLLSQDRHFDSVPRIQRLAW
jgi:predicted nucleic acid-binding protein